MATNQLQNLDVPADLFDKVMLRLDFEQRLRVVRRHLIAATTSLVALVALVIPVWNSFQLNLSQSGFMDYLSLGFYDFKSVALQWQDFSFSLLESFPIVSAVELLTVVLALLLILKLVVTSTRTFVVTSHALNLPRSA